MIIVDRSSWLVAIRWILSSVVGLMSGVRTSLTASPRSALPFSDIHLRRYPIWNACLFQTILVWFCVGWTLHFVRCDWQFDDSWLWKFRCDRIRSHQHWSLFHSLFSFCRVKMHLKARSPPANPAHGCIAQFPWYVQAALYLHPNAIRQAVFEESSRYLSRHLLLPARTSPGQNTSLLNLTGTLSPAETKQAVTTSKCSTTSPGGVLMSSTPPCQDIQE